MVYCLYDPDIAPSVSPLPGTFSAGCHNLNVKLGTDVNFGLGLRSSSFLRLSSHIQGGYVRVWNVPEGGGVNVPTLVHYSTCDRSLMYRYANANSTLS